MQCENCEGRMRCTYSVPAAPRVRYRVYKCPYCGGYGESVEMPLREANEKMGSLVGAAQRKRMGFIYRKKHA